MSSPLKAGRGGEEDIGICTNISSKSAFSNSIVNIFLYFYYENRVKMDNHHEFYALIVEDDALNASSLNYLLEDHFPNIKVTGIAASIHEARALLSYRSPDLLFLDMELPDGKGFDLLTEMPEVHFEVIVTTAHSNYMLDAIRHSALDFLIKPIGLADLGNALGRFIRKHESGKHAGHEGAHQNPHFRKLPLPTLEGYVFVDFDEIVHAEADRSYSVFSLINQKKIMVSKPLGDFKERLFNRNFIQVHNSHIINLSQVSEYVRGEGGYVVMTNQAIIPVSRSRKEDFLKAIGSL
jgi:two-component system LytT family response regulator